MANWCCKCFVERREDNFYSSKHAQCKTCIQTRRKELLKDPIKRAKKREQDRRYYQSVGTKYHWTNREKELERLARYRKANREKLQAYDRAYKARRIKEDPLFALKQRIRMLIKKAFNRKRLPKTGKTRDILGCSLEEFFAHLQQTWERNYPGQTLDWKSVHIDHVTPLATAHTVEEVLRLNHYSNLQLLTPADNLAKAAKCLTSSP